jgi:hypothetical protein
LCVIEQINAVDAMASFRRYLLPRRDENINTT